MFYRFVPTASISSIKTIDGACSSATLNSSRTSLGPSPCTNQTIMFYVFNQTYILFYGELMKTIHYFGKSLVMKNNQQIHTKYFWMSSEPTTRRKVAEVWLATALANKVLPVPGGP